MGVIRYNTNTVNSHVLSGPRGSILNARTTKYNLLAWVTKQNTYSVQRYRIRILFCLHEAVDNVYSCSYSLYYTTKTWLVIRGQKAREWGRVDYKWKLLQTRDEVWVGGGGGQQWMGLTFSKTNEKGVMTDDLGLSHGNQHWQSNLKALSFA